MALVSEIPSIVTVAPAGADFHDPVDAAIWVADQSPAENNRFVILIAPGQYFLDAPIIMPSYTTIKGICREQCAVFRYDSGSSLKNETVITCVDVHHVAIESLSLFHDIAHPDESRCIYVCDSYVEVSDVDIVETTEATWAAGIWAETDSNMSRLTLQDVRSYAVSPYDPSTKTAGLKIRGNVDVFMDDCSMEASGAPFSSSPNEFAVYHGAGSLSSDITAKNSVLTGSCGFAYFRERGDLGRGRFYGCELHGDMMEATKVIVLYCHDGEAPL